VDVDGGDHVRPQRFEQGRHVAGVTGSRACVFLSLRAYAR
jgi:hypothetical protein